MMQQLRSPEGKKRRRRSQQPVYDSRRHRRTIAIILISLATLSTGGCFSFRWFQKIRLEGDTFRDALNRRLTDELGCAVKVSRIYDGGESSLAASEARIDLYEKDLLEYGQLNNLNASLTSASWVSDSWGITRLTVDDIKLRLNPERALLREDTMWIRPTSKGREKSKDVGWRMGISPDPDIISLDHIQIARNLTIEWPALDTENKVEGLSDAQAAITLPLTGGLKGSLLKGMLSLKGLPVMNVREAHWKLNGRALRLEGSMLVPNGGIGSGEGGVISADGDIDLQVNGSARLSLDMNKVPVETFFSSFWKQRISGLAAVKDATFTATFTGKEERTIEGDFSVTGFLLGSLPFVPALANHMQRPDFAKGMEFPEFTGHFTWSPLKGLTLTNLKGERPGELRIGGSLTASPDGKISGAVTFGAHDSIMALVRSAGRPHPFMAATEGWNTVTFQLNGAGSSISDNLPSIDQAPSAPPAPQKSQGTVPPAGNSEEEFNQLIQPR